jgi:DNA (cytosine-5)-methyltransferase 1
VFVVGCIGNWRAAAAVLFDRHSLSGNPAPSREKGKGIASFPKSSIGGYGESEVAGTMRANGGDLGGGSETIVSDVAAPLDASMSSKMGQDNQHINAGAPNFIIFEPRSPDGVPRISKDVSPRLNTVDRKTFAHTFKIRSGCEGGGKGYLSQDEAAFTLDTTQSQVLAQPISFASKQQAMTTETDLCSTIGANDYKEPQCIAHKTAIRRLTPIECERLQGFPDGFTKIPYRGKSAYICPDGPRYKALGNSMAVPVVHWIGKRIHEINQLLL